MHLLNREVACDCLDIATIEVDEEHRGKGVFTRFLTLVEEEAEKRHMAVWVESIQEPRLIPFLKARGYQQCPFNDDIAPTYYKLPTKFENKLKKLL